ncbi:MAG TPA: hypothetical protein VF731_11815 [Solirubrobacterales bacterium]
MRGSSRLAALALALALLAMLGGTAAAKPHHKHGSGLHVRILRKSQSAIARKGLLVKVSSAKPRKLKLRVVSTTFDDGTRPFAKARVVRLRGAGHVTVRLPLNRAGRRGVKSCTQRTIEVRAGKAGGKVEMRRTGKCQPQSIEMKNAEKCDFIAEPGNALCMLPFPDDYYTVEDPSTETGRRIDFQTEGMPVNTYGTHIEAGPYNASDGFSPGETILVKVPGIETTADVAAMGATPINHIGQYTEKNAPVVVIDATTGKRWPIWVEIDSTASDPSKRVLEIHPAVDFEPATRYIVALRNVKNAAGKKIEAPEAFRYYRDEIRTKQSRINARRKHFKSIFRTLKTAGIRRENLYLAWDFTVASDANNYRRMLAMRNDAFAQLGDTNLADGVVQGKSPEFKVTSVEKDPNPGEIARRVKGTVTVPCYLFPSCEPGGTFHLGPGEAPQQNGTWEANFDCIIPDSATTGAAKTARPSLYGHGLFGSASEVASSPQRALAQGHDMVFCATNEIGMSSEDQGRTLGILNNLSGFPQLTDRLQQGMLDELYLGRAMINPAGFASSEAFTQDGTGATETVLDTSHLYYNGNSQGGIEGGALTAIAPDFTRASLGVPAMTYSVLLPRSVDFDEFAKIMYPAYPDETERPLALDLIQMLWDRAEPNGYAHRMTTNPLPDTPAHQVLLDVALGDHQVTDYQADVEARTIGASAHAPALYNGRWPNTEYLWNVPSIGGYPFIGSAVYYWDIGPIRPGPTPGTQIGVEPPPYENLPNRLGEDPHGAPRAAAAEQQLVSDFFEGAIPQTDTCGGGPCYAGTFTGP